MECIWGIWQEYCGRLKSTPSKADTKETLCLRLPVPGLTDRIWSQSMEDTRYKCYVGYHTDAYTDAVLLKAPTKHYHAADHWVRREQQRYSDTVATSGKVRRELDTINSKRKDSKERTEEDEEACCAGEVQSGSEAVQS